MSSPRIVFQQVPLKSRVFNPVDILLGRGDVETYQNRNADWSRAIQGQGGGGRQRRGGMYSGTDITCWAVVCPRDKCQPAEAMVDKMEHVARGLGIRVDKPSWQAKKPELLFISIIFYYVCPNR